MQSWLGLYFFLSASAFSLIDIIVVIAAIYSAFNSLYLKFDGMKLLYRRKFLWFTLTNKSIPYSQISAIDARKSSSNNSGGKHKITYKVYAKTGREKWMLVESVDSASKKERLVEYFKTKFPTKIQDIR